MQRPTWSKIAALSLLVIGGIWFFRPKPLTEFPRPPIPKAYPACPDAPSNSYDWHGVIFQYPAGWVIKSKESNYEKAGERTLFIRPRPRRSLLLALQSIVIVERNDFPAVKKAVDAAWLLPKGETIDYRNIEMMGDETVPKTIQRLEIGGHQAVLFLRRGLGLLPKEHDQWSLLIKGEKSDYAIGSSHLFNPYRVVDGAQIALDEELEKQNNFCECAYWTFVKSLKLP